MQFHCATLACEINRLASGHDTVTTFIALLIAGFSLLYVLLFCVNPPRVKFKQRGK